MEMGGEILENLQSSPALPRVGVVDKIFQGSGGSRGSTNKFV